MRIAIAGATGSVGRHILDTARGRGHEVVALSRSSGQDVSTGTGLVEAVAVSQHAHHPGTADTADHLETGRLQPVSGLTRRAVFLMGQLGVAVQVLVEVLLPTADLIGAREDGGYGIVHRFIMAITP